MEPHSESWEEMGGCGACVCVCVCVGLTFAHTRTHARMHAHTHSHNSSLRSCCVCVCMCVYVCVCVCLYACVCGSVPYSTVDCGDGRLRGCHGYRRADCRSLCRPGIRYNRSFTFESGIVGG